MIFLAASIPLGLAGPFSGRIGERFDIPRSMLAACGVGAAGLLLLSFGPGLAGVLAAFVLYGGGYGFGWSMASVGTQVTVPPERAGIASGVTLAVLIGCGGLAIATLSTLTVADSGSAAALGSSLESAFLVIGIGSVLAATALVPLAHEGGITGERAGDGGSALFVVEDGDEAVAAHGAIAAANAIREGAARLLKDGGLEVRVKPGTTLGRHTHGRPGLGRRGGSKSPPWETR